MFGKRRGISTFIATLLLMVLAVSAGVVIYAYTMGYMGGFGGTDTLGAMSLDEATMDQSAGTITAYVRNIGRTDLTVTTAYLDDVPATITSTTITEGSVGTISIPHSAAVSDIGNTFEVKLICEDNTQLSFSVKCEA
jgi:hypothetical protein